MRVGVVGDVHSHFTEMTRTINALEEHGVDRIILLGDLVDRGPSGLSCLRYIRTERFMNRRGDDVPFECVKGNHEDAYVRVWRGIPKPGRARVEPPEYRRLYMQMDSGLLRWMEQLPAFIAVPQLGLVCTHGGVTPHMTDLEAAGDFVLRTRYLDKDGNALRSVFGSSRFWAAEYDGRFGTIVFGHESHVRPTQYDHAIAIDGEGFRHVHAVVMSDEDEPLAAYTTPYGAHTREADLVTRARRYHDVDVPEQLTLW